MIIRAKNGQLVKILRSSFTSDSDYYLAIIQLRCGKDAVLKNNLYKSQQDNIELIENIINA